jgi:hypothetical protein
MFKRLKKGKETPVDEEWLSILKSKFDLMARHFNINMLSCNLITVLIYPKRGWIQVNKKRDSKSKAE